MTTGIMDLMKPSSNDLPACNMNIYNNGVQVAVITGGSARLIQRYVQELAEYTGEPVDWHYVGGRGLILTTGNINKVREGIMSLTLDVRTNP